MQFALTLSFSLVKLCIALCRHYAIVIMIDNVKTLFKIGADRNVSGQKKKNPLMKCFRRKKKFKVKIIFWVIDSICKRCYQCLLDLLYIVLITCFLFLIWQVNIFECIKKLRMQHLSNIKTLHNKILKSISAYRPNQFLDWIYYIIDENTNIEDQ